MSKTLNYILVVTMLLIGIIIFSIFLNIDANKKKEKEWYSENMKYKFCAIVIDKEEFEQKWGYGYIVCVPTDEVQYQIEDSLNLKLIYNQKLRFIDPKENGRLGFVVPGIADILIGDTICVNSQSNTIGNYRFGKLISSSYLSHSIWDRR
jgi:hypothetical protein